MSGTKGVCHNVYAELGLPNAAGMLVRAQLVSKIDDIIRERKLTQKQAAVLMGMTQSKVSKMLNGQFRGISEAKLLDCLAALGNDVEIRVKPVRRKNAPGKVAVVFTA